MGCPLFEISMKGKTKKKVQEQFGKLLLVAIFALPVAVAAAGLKPLTLGRTGSISATVLPSRAMVLVELEVTE